MPTLTLPSVASGAVQGTASGATEGTEGREGSNTAAKNSGETAQTWTRLLQSFMEADKNSNGAVLPVVPSTGTATKYSSLLAKPSRSKLTASSTATAQIAASPVATTIPVVQFAVQPVTQPDSSSPALVKSAPSQIHSTVSSHNEAAVPSQIHSTVSSHNEAAVPSQILSTVSSHSEVAVPVEKVDQNLAANSPQDNAASRTVHSASQSVIITSENLPPALAVPVPPVPSTIQTPLPVIETQVAISAVNSSGRSISGVSIPNGKQSSPKGMSTESVRAGMSRASVLDEGEPTGTEGVVAGKNTVAAEAAVAHKAEEKNARSVNLNSEDSVPGSASVTSSAEAPTQSARSASPITTSSRTERSAVIDQISSHIQSQASAKADPSTVTIRIQPAHWGEMKIAVTFDHGTAGSNGQQAVSATITTSNPEVQSVVQEHEQDLKSSLQSAGLHLQKLDVDLGSANTAVQASSSSSSGHHAGQQQEEHSSDSRTFQMANNSSMGSGNFGNPSHNSTFSGSGDDSADKPQNQVQALMPATVRSQQSSSQNGGSGRLDMKA